MIFDINDIARIGAVRDIKPYMLPPEAWTIALNMRYEDESLKTIEGWGQVFGTPPQAPHFGMFISMPTALLVTGSAASVLAWASMTDLFWWDGTSHTEATRLVGGDYITTNTRQWNGTIAAGGIPIMNNGVDIPQYSLTPGAAQFSNLANWPTTWRAKVVRAFGPHIIAINMYETATEFPHRVRWSHPAVPGSVPVSWDEADPTRDAGLYDMPDAGSGILMDALPLGSIMYLYKETSIWRMRYVGGQSKFDFSQNAWVLSEGILGMGCVCLSGDGTKHVFATTSGDIMWHDGNQINSILTQRQRRRLQGDIDPIFVRNSFIFANPFTHSIWFCYPSAGNEHPNKALHLSYKMVGGKEWSVTEVDGITFRNAVSGPMPSVTFGAWDEADGILWDDDETIWDGALGSGASTRELIFLDPTASRFYGYGNSHLRNGVAFTSRLQRIGLGLIGKKRTGEPIVDFQRKKMITRIFPKITGGSVNINFNSQQEVDGAVSSGSAVSYDPSSQVFADPQTMQGRAVGIEISGSSPWQIDGYKINIEPLGEF